MREEEALRGPGLSQVSGLAKPETQECPLPAWVAVSAQRQARFSLAPEGLVSGSQVELHTECGGGYGAAPALLSGSSQARETEGFPAQITLVKADRANCYHPKVLCEYGGWVQRD